MFCENPNQPSIQNSLMENIRLIEEGPKIMVTPPGSVDAQAFAPFELPKIHKSLSDWLLLLSQSFMYRRHRCMAMLLFMDCQSRNWGMGIPSQRASKDASCWTALRSDFAHLPASVRVAGSFQLRILSAGEEACDAVPNADGVHLVAQEKPDRGSIWSFLRLGDRLVQVPATFVIMDDLEAALAQCDHRVKLM